MFISFKRGRFNFEKGTKIVLREAIMKYTEALKLNCCSGGESMRTDNLIINGYGLIQWRRVS